MSQKMFDEAMRTKPLVDEAIRRMRIRVLGASAVMSDTCDHCEKYDHCDDGLVTDVAASVKILGASLKQALIRADQKEPMPDAQLHLFFEMLVLTSSFGAAGENEWGDEGAIRQVLEDENLYPDDGSIDELERVGKHIADKLISEIKPDDTVDVERHQLALTATLMLMSDHLAGVRDQGGITETDRLQLIANMEHYCAGSLQDDRAKRKLH
jgi:hypothetical protein